MYYSRILKIICIYILSIGCKENIARNPINKPKKREVNSSIMLAKSIYLKEVKNIKKFIKLNLKRNFKFYENGFWYHIEEKGKGAKIKKGDNITIQYKIFNLKGELFYDEQYKTFLVDKESEIIGVSEGVKLMNKGAKYTFIFPSYKAYDYHGDNKKILPNTTLLYEVKILNIN